jgi:hypothetical protein
MICSTAEEALSSSIVCEARLPAHWGQAAAEPNVPFSSPLTVPSADVFGPHPAPAAWLQAVERRIRNSVLPLGHEHENDGRWLSSDIATTATAFFELASDVLPGEPHIYSSLGGDLVAEFSGPRGVMNAVISAKLFVALAVVDGEPKELKIDLAAASPKTVRDALKAITERLRDREHGRAMGT